jgi:transcriptional regulator
MYRLAHYDESRPGVLRALIDAYPFATLVLASQSDIVANHVPLLMRAGPPPAGLLVGHVARANPLWTRFAAGHPSLVIFQGGDHYISPRWYRSGQADGKAVPTWDYSVVHARGPIEWIEDRTWLQGLLEDMAVAFERDSGKPWHPREMPAEYRDSMLDRIVGFQIPVESLQGKFKLNQGSTTEDRSRVVSALRNVGSDSATAMAAAIERATPAAAMGTQQA